MHIVTSAVGNGLTRMEINDTITVFFEKDTPVAATIPGIGSVTTEGYSKNAFSGHVVSRSFIESVIANSFS